MPPEEIASLRSEVSSMKLSINDLENQVETLIKTVTELSQNLKDKAKAEESLAAARIVRAQEWAVLKAEHVTCLAERQRDKTWLSGRIGALIDKFLPAMITAAILFLALKGGKL